MENRKVRLTKSALKDALVELMSERPLEKITVTALCEHADVNRSTFYSHYESLADVVDDLEGDFLSHVTYFTAEKSSENLQLLTKYLEYIRANRRLFEVLYKNGRIVQGVCKESERLYLKQHNIPPEEAQSSLRVRRHRLYIRYACTGTYQMIYDWLQDEETYSPRQMAEAIFSLSTMVGQSDQRIARN
ncbi:MAG: TetR/AcrR family transcriptional regulator [Tractidigestivibacter sp.]|uniref:TetR/AcrR family transcriptional regulator n=1 Tax=Tractidigestivibacter sp. TaxID=2847320 RepID=UPI003D8BCF63